MVANSWAAQFLTGDLGSDLIGQLVPSVRHRQESFAYFLRSCFDGTNLGFLGEHPKPCRALRPALKTVVVACHMLSPSLWRASLGYRISPDCEIASRVIQRLPNQFVIGFISSICFFVRLVTKIFLSGIYLKLLALSDTTRSPMPSQPPTST